MIPKPVVEVIPVVVQPALFLDKLKKDHTVDNQFRKKAAVLALETLNARLHGVEDFLEGGIKLVRNRFHAEGVTPGGSPYIGIVIAVP